MWVLGLHKVHGEESIVVLLVHGELILSCSDSSSSMAHSGCSCSSLNQLVHLFSFLFQSSPFSCGMFTQFQTLPSLSLLWVIPLLGPSLFPHPLISSSDPPCHS
ncbi:unnamed protein product [Microthlaspi erraticum]|uniref:Uncharacterized protein n=1 Tax=Microthlaspi erraticum TaxID=1685480 RepID=A0A6D2KAS2_9BRAS|nr:unnamed protein product [Microthlaspi erraticum]